MSFDVVFASFGGAANVWFENDLWTVLARPKQVTLGSSILLPKRSILRIGELTNAELIAFGGACGQLEDRLANRFAFDKINYLMLAMKDPLLHFHVIPRYSSERHFDGRTWLDTSWPKPPDMTVFVDDAAAVAAVRKCLSAS